MRCVVCWGGDFGYFVCVFLDLVAFLDLGLFGVCEFG